MRLGEYLQTHKIDDHTFAALLGGVSSHAVKKWRYRERTPRLDAIRKIQEATGGAVTPADFVEAPEPSEPAGMEAPQ